MTNTEMLNSPVEQEEEIVNIREIVTKYIYHWPVFILGIIVCFVIAFVYLRYVQPIYSVTTTLMIKDQKQGNIPAGGDLLNDLDLFGSSKVVDNEIEILKSKALMHKVVDRLNLSVALTVQGHFKSSDLYATKGVQIIIEKTNPQWYGRALNLSFPKHNVYVLEDEKSGERVIGNLDQLERNKFGVYKILVNKDLYSSLMPDIEVVFRDPQVVSDEYLSALNVTLASKQSTVLTLTIQSAVPEKGQDILNTLVQVYNEAALTDKNKTTESTIQFIDERLKLISGELTDVEKDVETFKSSRGLTDISSDANLFLENIKTNDQKLNEINLQLSVVEDIKRYVNSNTSREKLPSTLGIDDPVLLGQISQLGELQLKRDQLLATTTESNPIINPLVRQIETTRAGIKSSISNISKSLQISKSGLEQNSASFQGSIKKIPKQERQFVSIKRQQTIKETLYLYLLQKKEEAALSYASSVADSRIVDSAFYSKVPVSPKRQSIYLFALFLGILLPAVYIYIRDVLNDRVTQKLDLINLTSTPVLGEVLFNEDASPIVVQANSRKAIAEQFRSIRTNMQFISGKPVSGKGRVILLTSSMSGEGKTFVASNIGAAHAINGKRTVLLELDLRKPKVSKYLNLTNKIGLSNYLIGDVAIDDIINSSGVDANFFVIGSGPIPPNPSELLSNPEMDILISDLKTKFDEIIIDSPPIGLVTDAQVLARLADVTIYLVRQNVTFKEQVKNLDVIYKKKIFPKLHVILNGIKFGGQYGYGYGYGYYAEDSQVGRPSFKTFIKNILKRF